MISTFFAFGRVDTGFLLFMIAPMNLKNVWLPFALLMLAIPAGAEEEWIPLFDGKSLDAWKGFKMDGIPDGWSIEDGVLYGTGKGKKRADLITKEKFQDYELVVEWKTEKERQQRDSDSGG